MRSWEVKRPNTRVFQLKEMPDKEQNIEKKKVSVIFWTFGKIFFENYINLLVDSGLFGVVQSSFT